MKFVPLLIITVLLLVNPVLAQGCELSGFMGTFKQGQEILITETCPTCSFINITIKDPNSNILVTNQDMSLSNGIFSYTLIGNLTKQAGTYSLEGFSNLDIPVKACFDVNPTGTEDDNLWFNFWMLFILASASFTLIYFFNESRNTIKQVDSAYVYYYLGAFMLFSVGIYTLIFGFGGGYKNLLTEAFGMIIWGSALFFLTRPYFTGGKWTF